MLTRRQTLVLLTAAGAGTVFALARSRSGIEDRMVAAAGPVARPATEPQVMGLTAPVENGDPAFQDPEVGGCNRRQQLDREVELSLSDGMKRQKWSYGDQRYVDEGERIVMNEGEHVLLTVRNDTGAVQIVRMDGALTIYPGETQIAAGDYMTVELSGEQLESMTLTHRDVKRIVEVRPSDQKHA